MEASQSENLARSSLRAARVAAGRLGDGLDQSVHVTGTRRKMGTLQEEAQAHQSHWPVSDNPGITMGLPNSHSWDMYQGEPVVMTQRRRS